MIKKYWNERYEHMQVNGFVGMMKWEAEPDELILNKVTPFINKDQKDIVIDFGCGLGHNVHWLINVFEPGLLIGYDIVQLCVDECKKRYPYVDPICQFELYEGKLEPANVIWSSFVLQHIPDDEISSVIEQFKNSSKADGILYMLNCTASLPNSETMFFRSIDEYKQLFIDHDIVLNDLMTTKVNGHDVTLFEGKL